MRSASSALSPSRSDDEGGDRLAPDVVGNPTTATWAHARVRGEHVLDLARIDVVAAGDDHVGGAVDQSEIALLVEAADVAGRCFANC